METVSEYETYDSIRYYHRVLPRITDLRLYWHRNRMRKEGCPNKQLEELLSDDDTDELELVYDILYHYYEDCGYTDEDDGDGMEVVHDFYTSRRMLEYGGFCLVYARLLGIPVEDTSFFRQAQACVERHLGGNSWGVRLHTDNENNPSIEILYYSEQEMNEIALLAGMLDVDYFYRKNMKKVRRAVKKAKRQIRRRKEKKNGCL